MRLWNNPEINNHRISKPLHELQRKRDKARRKGWWTVEDIDYCHAFGKRVNNLLKREKK